MPLPFAFNWKNPDYDAVMAHRSRMLTALRERPEQLPHIKQFYIEHPAQFIIDWGMTFDPRNLERGLPAIFPFMLFPKQEEWVSWFIERWRNREPGITEKSRDVGVSWLTVSLACTLCMFHEGMVVGFGSRKEEYVDKLGHPKSLFEKARFFMSWIPRAFKGSWDISYCAPHMRIQFPDTGSVMTGESGDGIGRGDRTSVYFVDESAFLERPELIEASLVQTTNCRQDVSTAHGMGNPFAIRRHSGRIKVFTFRWQDDPRKDEEWYKKQEAELDPVTLKQEVDIDYHASTEGALIPSTWTFAAVDADKKLGLTEMTGAKRGGLDVADEGADLNVFAARKGPKLTRLTSWSGKGGDIYETVVKAFGLCEDDGLDQFDYDADGLGAGVRGDARKINEARESVGKKRINDQPFRGSGAVDSPDGEMIAERKNKDYFANAKAQAWFALRMRFQATWRALQGQPYNVDDLIIIDGTLAEKNDLLAELSQITYKINQVGKVVIEKTPDGTKSPNRADAVMIAYQPGHHSLDVWSMLGQQAIDAAPSNFAGLAI